jgi:phosphopantothenoylcysteine decarboxylase/phosphopantothenate--cysteine ligase
MGFAIAEELYRLGARVTLISGPTALTLSSKTIKRIDVVTAEDLLEATLAEFSEADITVMSAAVADYKPEQVADQKIKKKAQEFSLNLIKTTDILAELGNKKRENQVLVGFALETENELANASDKLKKKNLDLIVLNSLNDEGAGFKSDLNKITILDKQLNTETFVLKPKNEVAKDICRKIIALIPHEKS